MTALGLEGLKGSIRIYIQALHEVAAYTYRRVRFIRMAYERVMTPRALPQPIRNVLFVCTANICRSPLAEAYFMEKARKEGRTITAKSAGIETQPGRPAHTLAKEIARQHGFSLERHTTRPLFRDLIQESDLVLVMEVAHKDRLIKLYPKDRHKVFVLGQFCGWGSPDIADPFKGTKEEFSFCFERIRESCNRVMKQLGGRDLTPVATTEQKSEAKEHIDMRQTDERKLAGTERLEFCCPECKGMLAEAPEAYNCNSCDRKYPIQEGIPCFSDMATYHGEVPKPLMSTIIKDSERLGYKKAFEKHIQDPFIYKYVGDETRSLWISVIPHNQRSSFLDIGCGWGTNAVPISQEVGIVYALDATYERVKFVQIRSHQDGKSNIRPVLGSAIKLPIPNNSLDIVAFNGVLEWLGGIDKKRSPVELQREALGEAWRVLKPGGYVYIGIENRYSLRYMLGDQDDHSFLRFTSLMPRRLANLYCRLRTGEPYFTYTHSLAEYCKLLREAHFSDIRPYLPWPDYRNPTFITPLERGAVLKHLSSLLRGGSTLSFRQKTYLSLLKILTACEGKGRVCHSFCFVAQK